AEGSIDASIRLFFNHSASSLAIRVASANLGFVTTTTFWSFIPSVSAVYERINCQPLEIPLLGKEGWLRHQKMMRSHLCRRRRGAQTTIELLNNHPVRSFQRRLRSLFLTSRPPLLYQEGNFACPANSFMPSMTAAAEQNEKLSIPLPPGNPGLVRSNEFQSS